MDRDPNQPENPLDSTAQIGTDSIAKLMIRFSIPSIVGMLVNALYNIVDRMFIGHGIGAMGIAGVTISFPIMLIMMSFSILVGVGANTLFSIRLGEGRREEAERILGNAAILLFVIPLAASLVALLYLDPLLRLLGTSEHLMPFARSYARIILYGSALGTTGHGLSHFIRSDGHPQIAMIAMLIGGILNTLLDALFIFKFQWGMEGAAWATVIAQALSFTWCFAYFLSPKASTRFHRRHMRLDFRRAVLPMLTIGFAPFAMNMANSLLNVILNRGLHQYGGDAAVAVMGIIMAYMSIIFMPCFGIAQGVQPLMGYNYGAHQYARVRQLFWASVVAVSVVMTLGWATSQLFPVAILRLFVPADSELIPIGTQALHIFTLAFPIIGFQIMSGELFQAIGKPFHAGFLALARQIFLFVPFIIIFPKYFGLPGIYAAAPVSDVIALLLASILIVHEMRLLRKQEKEETA
jgi:MATE family, multidrug efflux pump